MIVDLTRNGFKAAAASAFAALAIAAAPASAQTEAAAVQTAAKAAESPLGEGDAEFRQLFASWEGIEKQAPGADVRTAVSVPSGSPLDGFTLTSGYGMRNHPVLRKRKKHNGIDMAAPTGTPIYATADGQVEMAQRFSSYGKYIQIDHGGEFETRYAHLSRIAVRQGETVRKGDLIGYVGSTGRSTGPHLHYEIRIAGKAVNPLPYMVETRIAAVDAAGAKGGPE